MTNEEGQAYYQETMPMGTPQSKVDRWNSMMPVGAQVVYRKDDGSKVVTKTRTEAQVLSGHTAVVWLDGVSGCVAIECVTPDASRGQT